MSDRPPDNTLIDRTGPFRDWAAGFLDRYGLSEPLDPMLDAYRRAIVTSCTVAPELLDALGARPDNGWRHGTVSGRSGP